jgi:hypothetical protein
MRSGHWLLALGTLTAGIALGALLGPRLFGGGAALKVQPPPHPEQVAPIARAALPKAVDASAPEPAQASGDAMTPKVLAPPAMPAATPAVTQSPPPLPPLPESPSRVDRPNEQSWRERTAAVRDRLVATYETCLAHAQTPYKYVIRDGRTTMIIDASAFADAKAAFLSAQSSLRFLQEEARRAGVPPGWVRVDWSGYSRNPSPENGVCERLLPEEIWQR